MFVLKITFVGHCKVSTRVFLTCLSPPTSSQPVSPGLWRSTPRRPAGVNPSKAESKLPFTRDNSLSSPEKYQAVCFSYIRNLQTDHTQITWTDHKYRSQIQITQIIWTDHKYRSNTDHTYHTDHMDRSHRPHRQITYWYITHRHITQKKSHRQMDGHQQQYFSGIFWGVTSINSWKIGCRSDSICLIACIWSCIVPYSSCKM